MDSPDLYFQVRSGQKDVRDVSFKELTSEKTLDDVLEGKKVLYGPYTMMFKSLSDRYTKKKKCGFFSKQTILYTLDVDAIQ